MVVLSGVGLARGLEPAVDAALLPLYQAFVRSVYGAGARQMGFSSRPDESEDARLLVGLRFRCTPGSLAGMST